MYSLGIKRPSVHPSSLIRPAARQVILLPREEVLQIDEATRVVVRNPAPYCMVDLSGATAQSSAAQSPILPSRMTEIGERVAEQQCLQIPRSSLLQVLQGVVVATASSDEDAKPLNSWITSWNLVEEPENKADNRSSQSFPFSAWKKAIDADLSGNTRPLAGLTLGVAYLRETCRQDRVASPSDLSQVWNIIYEALTSNFLRKSSYNASRSAQGFLAVPLCSLIKDGCIDELFRLHVWMPDAKRGDADFAVHSHQPFAQSWVLVGEGLDQTYHVEPVSDREIATHAEYELAWLGKGATTTSKDYKTHQTSSTVVNTGRLVAAKSTRSAVHKTGDTYTIPEASFHTTTVAPDLFHATLFFFDSHRGFFKDAGVLGPKDMESTTQLRAAAGTSPSALAEVVAALRTLEGHISQGRMRAQIADWEHGLRAYENALSLCESNIHLRAASRYRLLVLSEIGSIYRRFGRFHRAKEYLEEALQDMEPSIEQVEISGELGVIYRHIDQLEDAKRVFQIQYDTAKQLGADKSLCRAVGNLGMVNYQLSQANPKQPDVELLELAIAQLNERVETARVVQNATWETIGLGRLSLCFTAQRNFKQAIDVAREAVELTQSSTDPTVIALTLLLYGRALLKDGQKAKALEQFNPSSGCTPAIALCKEPSKENREYLRELVACGVDLDRTDEQGYSALDYAAFNGDLATVDIVLDGIRNGPHNNTEAELQTRMSDARVRKGYREIFQERMRPVLFRPVAGENQVHSLRRVYAEALLADPQTGKDFDKLKFVRYTDFQKLGGIQRSNSAQAQRIISEVTEQNASDLVVIFFSYCWIGGDSPDDEKGTQYHRMNQACEDFLRLHPTVDREMLGIWVVRFYP